MVVISLILLVMRNIPLLEIVLFHNFSDFLGAFFFFFISFFSFTVTVFVTQIWVYHLLRSIGNLRVSQPAAGVVKLISKELLLECRRLITCPRLLYTNMCNKGNCATEIWPIKFPTIWVKADYYWLPYLY